jgi:hypothetical protein
MPAETNQHHEQATVDDIVEFLGCLLEIDDGPGAILLSEVGLDDDLGLFSLWEVVVNEFAERALGELDLADARVDTLRELAEVFVAALHQTGLD